MSHVTDLVVFCSILEEPEEHPAAIRELDAEVNNQETVGGHRARWFERVDEYAGGNKVLQSRIFMSAVNYLDVERFVRAFLEASWCEPHSALLIYQDENDKWFSALRATGDRL